MILSLLSSGYGIREILPLILLTIPIILISLTVHECAHGFVSYKLGDPTAKESGRLTLNPLAHIEPIGAICMLLFGFGWAKPVPVNAGYYKRPKAGMAAVAAAGPLSNLLLSFIGVLLLRIFLKYISGVDAASVSRTAYGLINSVYMLLYMSSVMNVSLALFNLLPFPPLDGSRLMFAFLPTKTYFKLMKYERYVYYALIAIILIGNITGFSIISAPLSFLTDKIISAFDFVVGLIPGL